MKRLLAVCLMLVLLLSMTMTEASASSSTATVMGGWLRLRASADTSGKSLGSYYTGTVVTILGKYGSWYHVTTPDGKVGFMLGDYLKTSGSSSSSSAVISGDTAYVTSQNGKAVRLRAGAGTSYHVIAEYAVGTKVTILSYGRDWHKVSINGKVGYMMASFLSAKPYTPVYPTPSQPSAPASGSVSAVIASKNGKNVNMRNGAGKGYNSIGSYAVGTKVSVITFGKSWSHVEVKGRTGYIMTEFLSNFRAYVTSSNGGSVHLRAGAGTNQTVLTSLSVGTRVSVLGYGVDWCYVSVNGWNGYMMTKYLRY